MGRWDGDLEGLTVGQIEALVAGSEDDQARQVPRAKRGPEKIKKTRDRVPLVWERGLDLYGDYDLGVKVPGYLVMLLSEEEDAAKLVEGLLRDYFGPKCQPYDEAWSVGLNGEVQEARDTFTRRFGLE